MMGREAQMRMGLTKGFQLSSVLFLIYITDLPNVYHRLLDDEVVFDNGRVAEVALTAHDVAIQTSD